MKFLNALLLFCLSILLLIAATFAWLTMNETTKIDNIIVPVGYYDVEIILEIKKNNGEYEEVETNEQMQYVLKNAVPNDKYYFRIKLLNNSSSSLMTNIIIHNILSDNDDAYDMRNVFFINDGRVTINDENPYTLIPNTEETEIIHEQELNLYRLNNLIDNSNSLNLIDNVYIEQLGTSVIEFALIYDFNTSKMGYQEGIIFINTIFIYFKNA